MQNTHITDDDILNVSWWSHDVQNGFQWMSINFIFRNSWDIRMPGSKKEGTERNKSQLNITVLTGSIIKQTITTFETGILTPFTNKEHPQQSSHALSTSQHPSAASFAEA